MRKRLYVCVIGNLDHGKSTLIGTILHRAGGIPSDRIKEIAGRGKGGCLDTSLLLDSLREEREGGFTLDVTQAFMSHRGRRFVFIDCPGHIEFLMSACSGASQAQAAIVVVSAKPGEGLLPGTRTHLAVASILGLKTIVVAVNKMDSIAYQKGPFFRIKAGIQAYLTSIGYRGRCFYVPVSARTGENAICASRRMRWYKGKPLIKVIGTCSDTFGAKSAPALRAVIQHKYTYKNRPVFMTRIEQGTLSRGATVFLNQCGEKRSISRILGTDGVTKTARAGNCCGIIFSGSDSHKVQRGEVISGLRRRPQAYQEFKADMLFLNTFYPGRRYILRCGLQESACTVKSLRRKGRRRVAITLKKRVVIDRDSSVPFLNRFIICDASGALKGVGHLDE